MRVVELTGTVAANRDQLHSMLQEKLQLPEWYGRNLDALHDCLTDLSRDVWIVLINGDLMDANLGDYAARLRTVFTDASKVPFAFRFFENPS